MVSDRIQCGYCKMAISRNSYGIHLLSAHHLKQFLKENEFLLQRNLKNKPTVCKYKVNGELLEICLGCKKTYSTTSIRNDNFYHLDADKSPACKEKITAFLNSVESSEAPGDTNRADKMLIEKLSKDNARLRKDNESLQELVDEQEENDNIRQKYYNMLRKMLGDAPDEFEDRFKYISENFSLPLFQ